MRRGWSEAAVPPPNGGHESNRKDRNLYCHRDAFGFIVQTPGANRVRLQSKYVLENLGILVVADTMYGAAELRDGNGYVLNGSTTASTS